MTILSYDNPLKVWTLDSTVVKPDLLSNDFCSINKKVLRPPCELLQYLFERSSPDVQVGFFGTGVHNESFDLPTKTIADFTFPRLRHLSVYAIYSSPYDGLSRLLGLLDQCSKNLKTLRLGIKAPNGTEHFEQIGDEPKGWTSLKELILLKFNNNVYTEAFFS
ncbi:MAG: hypothetical protein J3Q66DRAFT_391000 [Benniella sp.]|nr:MAG: hypothetical protein J3Q66DRAFT_391000 [Benniella sp.]